MGVALEASLFKTDQSRGKTASDAKGGGRKRRKFVREERGRIEGKKPRKTTTHVGKRK